MPGPKSPSYANLLSPSSSNLFSDPEITKPIKIKFTSSSAASPQPKWKDTAREIEADIRSHGNQSPPSSDLGSPVAKQLDPHDRLTFGKIPMNESPDLISCPKCSRPIIRHAVKEHLESCGKAKDTGKNVGNDKDKVNGNGKSIPNGEIAVMPPKSKKRKHDEVESVNGETTPPKKKSAKRDKEDSETPKKEKKKKPKPTVTKPKLPVDVEKQCGVFDVEKGTMCARSLTCKSHSMSAKRAVPGRSQPYDTLLSQWQRKNQAKATTTTKAAVQQEAEDVDSEEEVAQVMQGVARRYARPLEQRCIVGVRRKVRGMRMYEGLKGALMNAVASMAGTGVGRGRRQSQAVEG